MAHIIKIIQCAEFNQPIAIKVNIAAVGRTIAVEVITLCKTARSVEDKATIAPGALRDIGVTGRLSCLRCAIFTGIDGRNALQVIQFEAIAATGTAFNIGVAARRAVLCCAIGAGVLSRRAAIGAANQYY